MTQFEEKKFEIGELKGISAKNIEEHLKLYAGYVKHSNLILQKLEEMSPDAEKNAYAMSEVQRRFGFEYNGMKNHEVFFDSLSGGAKTFSDGSLLQKQIENDFGSFDKWLGQFKMIASTRGIGWAMLYWDTDNQRLLNAWVDEHHLGQLNGCRLILGLDMWEHAYVADYQPSGKKQYIEDFFSNLNWENIEKNYTQL
jgi:superoxide dismutase, Fe-Mn family